MEDEVFIGCCGAYCRTCRVFAEEQCKGCKIGYSDYSRDISKAKCRIKVCCMTKKNNSCADCNNFSKCEILNEFYGKNGYKYDKYKEALIFIRENGYKAFFSFANKWNMQYGKYK
jgi:hypothetical protein